MTSPGVFVNKFSLSGTLGLILILTFLLPAAGQITSPTADHVDTLGYLPGNTSKDPLFVFYQTDGIPAPGALSAAYPGPGNFNFEWRKYNPGSGGFDPAFSSDAGTTASSVSDLEEGGYQVRVWNGAGTDTTMVCWVFLNRLTSYIEQTDEGLL